MTTQHPTADVLSAFAAGNLPTPDLEPIERHVADCETCRVRLDELPTRSHLERRLRELEAPGTATLEQPADEWLEELKELQPFTASAEEELLKQLDPPEQPGELGRLGRYRILSKLGYGGMGCVFKALHPVMEREVALKVVSQRLVGDPASQTRFRREIRAVAKLHHPNIVEAYDADSVGNIHFLVTEFVEGIDLAKLVKRQGPLAVAQAADVVRQAALALQHSNEKGLVHRDIKPSNLILTPDGRVKLLDLGLARICQEVSDQQTSGDMLLGTPDFMAPEQGTDAHAVDIRADIYSLGCTLYFLLTARLPFPERRTVQKLVAHHVRQPRPLQQLRPELPPPLVAVVNRMMAKEPAARYSSPAEVVAAIEPFTPSAPARESAPRRSRWASLLTEVALAAIAALAGVVIYVQTDKGTLEISSDDEDVRVVVERAGKLVTVIDKKSGKEIKLSSGDYQLDLGKESGDLELSTREVTLKRGTKTVATIRRVPDRIAKAPEEKSPVSTSDAASVKPTVLTDHEKPFVVLSANGKLRGEFKHFAEALAAIENDDAIEIRGNGPYQLGHVQVSGKALTIRAAPGFRPLFVPGPTASMNGWWFDVVASPLTVEGCDFRSPIPLGLFHAGSASDVTWELRNCRFVGGLSIIRFFGKKLRFEDCLISTWGQIGGVRQDTEVELTNNLVWFGYCLGLEFAGGQTVRLQHNTFVQSGAVGAALLSYDQLMVPTRPISVEASGNVFVVPWAVVNRFSGSADWLGKLRWQGRNNLYVGERALAINDPGGVARAPGTLAEWFHRFGEEPGSQHVPRALFQWDQPSTEIPDNAVASFENFMAQLHRRHPQASENLGPNWAVVGPGQAYGRSLESNGQPAETLVRSPAPPGGPFVVWRNARAVRAVEKLQDAINVAASGDTIIVHTDGEVPSVAYDESKRLNLRAARGFQPTLEGPLGGVSTVEGFHFRKPLVALGTDQFVNCAFDEGLVLGTSPAFASDAKQPLEIINCLIAEAVEFQLPPNRKLTMKNSAVGGIVTKHSGEHPYSLELDHCAMWQPGPLLWNNQLLVSGVTNSGIHPLTVTARHTLFETGISLLWNDEAAASVTWAGSNNLYRVGGSWRFQSDIVGLDGWRRRYNTEELDSLEADPQHYDPLEWRLLPSSPGHAAAPDGRDLGADVTRVAR